MAKFCTKCGKPLKDGKPCNCNDEVLNDNTNTGKNQIPNELINNLLIVLKGTFKNPITTMKKIKKESYFITGIITIIASILGISLFVSGLLKTVLEAMSNSITSTFRLISGNKATIDINVFGLWFKVFIAVAIFYGVYTLLAWLITNKFMKKNNSYKELIATLSVPATISATTMIISWLFIILFGTSTVGTLLYSSVLSFGSILFSIYLYNSIIISTDVKPDYAGYIHFASIFVASIIIGLILSAMLSSYIGNPARSYTSSNSLFGYIHTKR